MTQPFAEGFPSEGLRPHQEAALEAFGQDQAAGEPITVPTDLGKTPETHRFDHTIVDEDHSSILPDDSLGRLLAEKGLMGKGGHPNPGSYPQTEVNALANAYPAQGRTEDIAAPSRAEGWTQEGALKVSFAPTRDHPAIAEQQLGRALRLEQPQLMPTIEDLALPPTASSRLLDFVQRAEGVQVNVSATPNLAAGGQENIPDGYLTVQQMMHTLGLTATTLREVLADSPFAGSIGEYPDEAGSGATVTGVPGEALPHILKYIRDKQNNQGDNN